MQPSGCIEPPKFKSPNKFCGGFGERETPVPIPNTAVKPLSADDTARATLWESKSPPRFFKKARLERDGLFCLVFFRILSVFFAMLSSRIELKGIYGKFNLRKG